MSTISDSTILTSNVEDLNWGVTTRYSNSNRHLYHLARMHARRDKYSTKLNHNTYGRVTASEVVSNLFEAKIRYHSTDIITVLYETVTVEETTGLRILAVEIDTGGWEDSVTTVRRINRFFRDNLIRYSAFTRDHEFFIMSYNDHREATQPKPGTSIQKQLREKNIFDLHTSTAFIPLSTPTLLGALT